MIKMKLECYKLGDLCTITSSKRIFAHQYVSEGVPFYRSKEIIEKSENKGISEPLFISNEIYEEIKNKVGVPQEDDVLITSVGTLGIPYVVKKEQFYFKDGNLTWLKNFSEKVLSQYIYYWLKSKFGYDSLINRAIGSSQGAITIDILKKYNILIPDIEIQKIIVNILSKYDEKIENNNKRIKILEQMAENLYKEWFVRFRFPGYENTEFENGIPKGWKSAKLKDLAKEVGKAICKENRGDYAFYLPIDFIPNKSMALKDVDSVENAESSLQVFDQGNILFGAMRPYFHKVLYSPFRGITRKTCFVLNAKDKKYSDYLYCLLYQKNSVDFANTVSVGSTMPYVRWQDFARMNILLPQENIVKEFSKHVSKILSRMRVFFFENLNLQKQRDSLLPRLMSGKLEIK